MSLHTGPIILIILLIYSVLSVSVQQACALIVARDEHVQELSLTHDWQKCIKKATAQKDCIPELQRCVLVTAMLEHMHALVERFSCPSCTKEWTHMRLSWACVRCHVRAHAPARNSKSSQKRAELQSSGKTDLSRDNASPRCTLFTSLKHVFPPAAMHCNSKRTDVYKHAGHLSHLSVKTYWATSVQHCHHGTGLT